MISFEYTVNIENAALTNIINRVSFSARQAMQAVVDEVVANVKSLITDPAIADTVHGEVKAGGVPDSNDFAIEGIIASTWLDMIFYEKGRRPGGKMPPIEAMLTYIAKRSITPDPEKTKISFAYAVNHNRVKAGRNAVPIDVLVDWQNDAGIEISDEFALKSLAFAIAKKIQRDGTPGKHAFERGLALSQQKIRESFEHLVISHTGF